jgi:high-affinity iron transporter
MLQALIVTLREGIEAAVMVRIVLGYVTKVGRNDLQRPVFAALGTAFVESIGVASLISRLNLNPVQLLSTKALLFLNRDPVIPCGVSFT